MPKLIKSSAMNKSNSCNSMEFVRIKKVRYIKGVKGNFKGKTNKFYPKFGVLLTMY